MKFLLIDNYPYMRHSVRTLLEEHYQYPEIVEATEENAFNSLAEVSPHVVVVDLPQLEVNHLELLQSLRHQGDPQVIILTDNHSKEKIDQLIMHGIKTIISKQDDPAFLLQAIDAGDPERLHLSESILADYVSNDRSDEEHSRKEELIETLTEREREIFLRMGEGAARKAIADQLFISVSTIETHISRIKEKLEFESGHDLLCYALRYIDHKKKSGENLQLD